MRQMTIVPNGWPCKLRDCPPGHFVYEDQLCFKHEYLRPGELDAFNSAGEYFWAGAENREAIQEIIVQPVIAHWDEDEHE